MLRALYIASNMHIPTYRMVNGILKVVLDSNCFNLDLNAKANDQSIAFSERHIVLDPNPGECCAQGLDTFHKGVLGMQSSVHFLGTVSLQGICSIDPDIELVIYFSIVLWASVEIVTGMEHIPSDGDESLESP